jgi:uncharacterized protein (TIGR03083 family)
MPERLQGLRTSVEHLHSVADRIDSANYGSPAHPSEWSIADTFSHIGSGAVIMKRRFEDSVARREPDPAFNPSVWDEWNAKAPAAQVADSLVADAALLECLEGATAEERAAVHFAMGPMTFDFDGLVGLRLGEHVLHTWDIEVTLDPTATLPNDAANLILDNIHMIVGFAGKPSGEEKTLTVRTLDPVRDFSLVFGTDSVSLVDAAHEGAVDLELPAETFVRLIYGRLDADHTPSEVDEVEIDALRKAFPGF